MASGGDWRANLLGSDSELSSPLGGGGGLKGIMIEEEEEAAFELATLLQRAEWVEQAASWPPLMAIRVVLLARLKGGLHVYLANWKAQVLLEVWKSLDLETISSPTSPTATC